MIGRALAPAGALALAAGLAGCISEEAHRELAPVAETRATITPETVAGLTILTYSDSHGSQVEYFAPDGRAFLWYPGNRGVVPSRWRVQDGRFDLRLLCFLYPDRSYNPATGEFGGNWECQRFNGWRGKVVDFARGDVFGLAGGAVPYPLRPHRTSIERLQAGPE